MIGFTERYKYLLIFSGILIIYFLNLFIDVMDVDAAQYASISMEMSQTDSYLEVYHRGLDYLDKPPLLFWLSSISMKIFGYSNFAYKLPSFLLAILGVYSTFRFARLHYSRQIAIMAAVILATSQALFQITNDVRTDTNLLAFVIFSVWQLSAFLQTNKWKHLIFGFSGVALAMLAKGPIGMVAVVAALGTDFLIKREWKHIFNWKWLVGILVVAIWLVPMTYGLYNQFDLHPEKTAYGIKSPSGVKFFYWTQSFGRITGESSWKDDTSFFFFFHSILWDFQPWILFLVLGLITTVRSFFDRTSQKFAEYRKEYITLGGFVLVFLALSLSRFKLPHYVYVTFPFAAIIAARYLAGLQRSIAAVAGQLFFNSLFWIILLVGSVLIFSPPNILLPVILGILFIVWWAVIVNVKVHANKIFFATIVTGIAFNLNLSWSFYPQLIHGYQGSSTAGKMAWKHNKQGAFFWYRAHDHTLDFYSKHIIDGRNLNTLSAMNSGDWVYTNSEGYRDILRDSLPFKVVTPLNDFPVAQLTLPFLLRESRAAHVDTCYLLERL